MLQQQIKKILSYYEETVNSADADHLYYLKQHTLVTELTFDETEEVYKVQGYRKE